MLPPCNHYAIAPVIQWPETSHDFLSALQSFFKNVGHQNSLMLPGASHTDWRQAQN